ncbi:MAG: hypothetical protein WA029_18885 [Anaerolineae bacterium]
MRYNTAAIRDLLNQALSDDELNTLAFDHFREIYDNYFTASLTRQQKTQILLEQVERRGDTERLLALVRELNPAQVTAFADQVLHLPSATARRSRSRWLLPLAAGLIVLGVGAFLLIRSVRPPPQLKYPQAATACQPSATPVKVAIRPLADCAAEVTAALLKEWKTPNAAPASISATTDAALRSWSQPDGYDLIVSGGCRGSESITLTFDLAAIRNADDLYQPASASVSGTLADVTQTGAALMTFQHGDYARAADQLTNLPLDVQSRDLALLRASALLFEQRYDEAIASLRELTRQNPTWSAAHINLGVALYNQSLLKSGLATAGEETLSYAVDQAKLQGDRPLELLALVNLANVYSSIPNSDQIKILCQRAETLDAQAELTRLCWLYYYFAITGNPSADSNLINRKKAEYFREPEISDSSRLQALRGIWSVGQGNQQEANVSNQRFLEQMQYHACLQQDREFITYLR